jgi:hypothetical protein
LDQLSLLHRSCPACVMVRVALVLAALAVRASAANFGHVLLAGRSKSSGFIRGLEFKHRLRVCNAYPYAAALDVFRGHEKLTSDAAMQYKACKDFMSPLKAGDKLEFKVGDANAGSFSVSDLPNNDAVLLLVIHRHDTSSTAVSFESHVFANLLNAQVAVIDTYKGKAKALPRILDSKKSAANKGLARSEELRYDSVVAVNPGVYEVDLTGPSGEKLAKRELVALNRESYVILRTGVESEHGSSFPEELVIYPQSDLKSLPSGAMMQFVLSAFSVGIVLLNLASVIG